MPKVRAILFFLFCLGILFFDFYGDGLGVARDYFSDPHQITLESFIIGRIVKSGRDGIFSAGGLAGLVGPDAEPPDTESPNYRFQSQAFLNSSPFQTYSIYKSQIGAQGIFYSAVDGILPFSPADKLSILHAIASLLSALMLSMVIFWFYREFGITVGFVVLAGTGLSQWLVIFAHSLWWSTWAFYLPMAAVMFYLNRPHAAENFPLGKFGILTFAAVMVKCFFNGYEYITTALVMMMTAPGLAMFYGGLVRRKNVLSTMMHSFFILCLISVQWVLWGYSLAFGPDAGHVIGNLSWLGLKGVGLAPNPDYAATIPHQLFMVYQMMFAVITPALISGAFAERLKFSTFAVFSLLWATLVYDPIAHWVWGANGWLHNLGALDFAGGTVVHISSGVSALVFALVLGKRQGFPRITPPPHNMTMTVIGAALLWFGWFGFNAGSALAANELAVSAFINTNTATAMAALSWLLIEWIVAKKPTVLGAATGAVAGLVAITPAAGFVTPMGSIAIGIAVAIVCYIAVSVIKGKLGYDDSLDAFGVHGVGGTVGALLTGVFASKIINSGGADGWIFGNFKQVGIQAIGVAATIGYAVVVTLILTKVLDWVMGLRVREEDEAIGLDNTQHKESAYTLID